MSAKGKILILKLNEQLLSILIRDNQILSIQVQNQNEYAVGNIYVGKVKNISENIGAAFVDLGQGYLTFLPLTDAKYACVVNRKADGKIKTGDEIPVQIIKEPMKTKLAGVTTSISLSGQYAVVGVPRQEYYRNHTEPDYGIQTEDSGGICGRNIVQISSKLSKKKQIRFRSIEALRQIAEHYQLIVRTNAGELTEDEPLIEEAQCLTEQLEHIMQIADKRTCYSCLYRRKPDYVHFIENTYTAEYDEVITDLPEIYEVLQSQFTGTDLSLRLYEDRMLPLYKLYAVETRIHELLERKVWLKSGGYLVIEPTEALISIDVNSGKCEQGKDKEETAVKINMEAAEMIAVHLRARNLSGIILVDFINFRKKEHERQLVEYMRSLLKKDSITADVVDMTGLGLMEITRKKVNPSFREQFGVAAPHKL
ncbi:MAG: ribonuclease E/G [Lachnospiraceae bacterium]|nr:ribonuclease E/G [Lachnospiraceae bacterium]